MSEKLPDELHRLVNEYRHGERQKRQEAWNLIADLVVGNSEKIVWALRRTDEDD